MCVCVCVFTIYVVYLVSIKLANLGVMQIGAHLVWQTFRVANRVILSVHWFITFHNTHDYK